MSAADLIVKSMCGKGRREARMGDSVGTLDYWMGGMLVEVWTRFGIVLEGRTEGEC